MGLKHRKKTGALTPYQQLILEDLHAGRNMAEIAENRSVKPQGISDEVALIRYKFDVYTTAQAVAQYACHLELHKASVLVLGCRVTQPIDEAEVHVNHVLEDLAVLLKDRAERLMPSDN